MKNPILLEITAPEARIIDEKIDERTGDCVTRVEVKWQHAGVVNGNGRRYRPELLQREVDKLLPLMKEGRIFGATYHPKVEAEVDDISHIWESVELKPDGSWMGVAKVLPTSRGKNAQAIIRNGGKIGMSSRGYGTVTSKEETIDGKTVKVDEVNDDFSLKSFGDFVLTPSVPDAGTRNILEARFEKEDNASETHQEEKMMKYKNLEELRAAEGDLLKLHEDDIAALKQEIEDLKAENAELKAQLAAEKEAQEAKNNKTVKDLGALVEGYVLKIREQISSMSELPGVIPEEDSEEDSEEDPKAGLQAELDAALAKIKELEDQIAALKSEKETESVKVKAAVAETKVLKGAQEAKDNQDKILKAIKEALEKESPEYRTLIETELIKKGKPVIEKLEEVTAKVTETKEKISTLKANVKKEEIVKSGIDEKGQVANPEKTAVQLTEEQIQVRWRNARAAGYKGSLEQYSKDVLHLNS